RPASCRRPRRCGWRAQVTSYGRFSCCLPFAGVHPRHAKGHNAGSSASSYSFLKRPINSAAGRILLTLPTPCPEPQISFHAFGLARSPEVSVPKLILVGSEVGRFSGSIPAATIDG